MAFNRTVKKCTFAGVLYMFYALALVCDHYFVPSLDVIIGRLSANSKRKEERYRTCRLCTSYYGGWFM